MAGSYATIANDGIYIEPSFYSKIEKKNGTLIMKSTQKSRRVFSKEVAYILKELLTQPVTGQNGTATYCSISGIDVAAKTGTTDENYDRWLCGFTPYYTAVTWYGYDKNESIQYNKKNPAGLLWANVMSRIHTGLKTARFEKPGTVSSVTVCSKTGKKARTGCKDTYIEYFLWGTAPSLCNEHSGNEFKNNDKTNNITNKVQDIVQGITEDIDAEDPQQTTINLQQNTKNTTKDNSSNSNNVINQNKTNSTTTNNSTLNTSRNTVNQNTSKDKTDANNNKSNANINSNTTKNIQ